MRMMLDVLMHLFEWNFGFFHEASQSRPARDWALMQLEKARRLQALERNFVHPA